MKEEMIIRGARQHNLQNIDLRLPRDKFIVFTGLSGSGKSSLAFDTIYAEGQRRYVESLSAYARQFLGQMDKPDVDYIAGLSPAISIDQKTTSRNRSNRLRMLFWPCRRAHAFSYWRRSFGRKKARIKRRWSAYVKKAMRVYASMAKYGISMKRLIWRKIANMSSRWWSID